MATSARFFYPVPRPAPAISMAGIPNHQGRGASRSGIDRLEDSFNWLILGTPVIEIAEKEGIDSSGQYLKAAQRKRPAGRGALGDGINMLQITIVSYKKPNISQQLLSSNLGKIRQNWSRDQCSARLKCAYHVPTPANSALLSSASSMSSTVVNLTRLRPIALPRCNSISSRTFQSSKVM